MLEKNDGEVKNGQSRDIDIDNTGHKTQDEDKNKTLKKPEGEIKNGQNPETSTTLGTRHRTKIKTKQKKQKQKKQNKKQS